MKKCSNPSNLVGLSNTVTSTTNIPSNHMGLSNTISNPSNSVRMTKCNNNTTSNNQVGLANANGPPGGEFIPTRACPTGYPPPSGEAPGGAPGASGALTPGRVNATIDQDNSTTLTIFHLNVQGLTQRNIPKLLALVKLLQFPDLLAITETWLKPHFSPELPGYACVQHRNRTDGRGGVALFAKNSGGCSLCVCFSK